MQRDPVISSNIAAIGYDPDTQGLEVEFTGGGVYLYRGVPQDVHTAFMADESKGRFFASHIKGSYPYEKVQ